MSKHKTYIDFWWNKGTKHIGLNNYKKPWKEVGNPPMFCIRTNGANKKNGDSCLDFSFHLGYWVFNYTNWKLQGGRVYRNDRRNVGSISGSTRGISRV